MSGSHLITLQTQGTFVPLSKRTGRRSFTLTNDYLFKAVLQTNEDILRALLMSLLNLPPDSIISALITNAIEPDATIHNKEAVLDIKLILNHQTVLNLEMQICTCF